MACHERVSARSSYLMAGMVPSAVGLVKLWTAPP